MTTTDRISLSTVIGDGCVLGAPASDWSQSKGQTGSKSVSLIEVSVELLRAVSPKWFRHADSPALMRAAWSGGLTGDVDSGSEQTVVDPNHNAREGTLLDSEPHTKGAFAMRRDRSPFCESCHFASMGLFFRTSTVSHDVPGPSRTAMRECTRKIRDDVMNACVGGFRSPAETMPQRSQQVAAGPDAARLWRLDPWPETNHSEEVPCLDGQWTYGFHVSTEVWSCREADYCQSGAR